MTNSGQKISNRSPYLYSREMDRFVDTNEVLQTVFFKGDADIPADILQIFKESNIDIRKVSDERDLLHVTDNKLPDLVIIGIDDEGIKSSINHIMSVYEANNIFCVTVYNSQKNKLPDHYSVDEVINLSDNDQKIRNRIKLIRKRILERRLANNNQKNLEWGLRHIAVVDELIKRSLGGYDIETVFNYIVQVITETLFVDYCEILKQDTDHQLLDIKSFFGNYSPEKREKSFNIAEDELAWKTLTSSELLVVDDFYDDSSYIIPQYLKNYHIVSGISITIPGESEPYGIMRVFTNRRRYFSSNDTAFLQSVVNILAVLIERKEYEIALHRSEKTVRTILETSLECIITIGNDGTILSFNKAAENVFGYEYDEIKGRKVSMLFSPPYNDKFEQLFENKPGLSIPGYLSKGEVTGRRKNGESFPMEIEISRVELKDMEILTCVTRDISERRRLEHEILDISEEERKRIGRDLHDGLGQMLTGIGLMSQNLASKLKKEGFPGTNEIEEITELLKEADEYARNLSRGLVPIEMKANGLSKSLKRLTDNIQKTGGISCRYSERGEPLIYDNTEALHLYRIAQEAINNALKHGKATDIRVELENNDQEIRLVVSDNGIGFPEEENENPGIGVRIMNYRARMIGGTLSIERLENMITKIICNVPHNINSREFMT
jgi:two-component system sensor kinase FixL